MEFRIEPTPLSRRRSRRILAATGMVVIVLAQFVAADHSAPPLTSAAAIARTGPPPLVVCHDVAGGRCTAIAQAALRVADDPTLPWPTSGGTDSSTLDVWVIRSGPVG